MRMRSEGVKNTPQCLTRPGDRKRGNVGSTLVHTTRRYRVTVLTRSSEIPYRRRRQERSSLSRSRWRRLHLILSKSRSRFRRRLKLFVRRLGPRPSQRPSRASWQLTNLPHFLSKPRDALRPRPWPIASVATLTTINRHNTRIPNRFPCFIRSSL